MSKKLTWEQVEARCNMYDEAANYFDTYESEDDAENQQAKVVQRQIRALCKKFYNDQCKKHGK